MSKRYISLQFQDPRLPFDGGELAQVAGCPWTMRDSSGSLAQNRWQGELALGVGQEGNGAAGMPAGHLMDASSPNHVSSPMHLKLGQKERVNETEYMDPETIDDWRDEEEEGRRKRMTRRRKMKKMMTMI
ncbi:hypothetical protein AALO_G00298240 [Alosa alosa]|uniref:Uncharacterized protein n=1 Tax=Alosa alosa TaxID=278164 RepID=A0AAV6FH14_9TELE|nr:hypothetical protein AALO_G00298240 [Alosa alosa]